MPSPKPSLIYYFIPGDSDDIDHPNAFPVMKSGNAVKLRDIRAKFPLPGTYHFRFKMKWGSDFVWMDVTNEESAVPVFEDKVFAKVLRVSWGDGLQSAPAVKAVPVGSSVAASPTPPPPVASVASSVPSAPRHASPKPTPVPKAQNSDMLDFGGGSVPAAPSKSPGKNDDFDMLFS